MCHYAKRGAMPVPAIGECVGVEDLDRAEMGYSDSWSSDNSTSIACSTSPSSTISEVE